MPARRCGWPPTSWRCERRLSNARARSARGIMNVDKIRNLTDVELNHQERELADQLFKLKFQLNMGQTESLKKIRGLRKDIARVKTILSERKRTASEKR